jgi:glutamate-1-semialdehyde 2,1-aminomutase
MLTLFFTDREVVDFSSAKTADTSLFAKYFQLMLGQGVYLPPSQFEAMFISTSVDQDIVDRILTAHKQALRAL